MKYINIEKAVFQERPNRFIAYVELNGKREKVHVKNTGRCRELLVPGTEVWLEKSSNPNRSTAYDLVSVRKGDRIVNMDSTAPNAAAGEWLRSGGLYEDTELVKPESTFGKSRFDFYVKTKQKEIWMEVKGVNLEIDNTALFPDAPSLRAVKHVEELIEAAGQGYEAVLLFVVQMEGILRFMPHRQTHPEFADALIRAREAGVRILARGCRVSPDGMEISYEIPVELDGGSPQQESPLNPAHGSPQPQPTSLPSLEMIAPKLLPWYDEHRRILPWREEPTPYRVWVSEIMLQQTRVEAVKPYFDRFMKRFPDIPSLAEAPEDELLKMWEGLGYYNRARNLQKAAAEIMERFGGQMPQSRDELLSLPGIGSYTAGAVASIAYQQRVPAVDGNVLRVLSRYLADERDMSDAKVKKAVEDQLSEVLEKNEQDSAGNEDFSGDKTFISTGTAAGKRPGDFNQALMELGATVCLPNGAPKCGECPLREECLANRLDRQLDLPRKAPKQKRTVEEKTILIIQDDKKTAIRKRPDTGLLPGMYEFPSLEGKVDSDRVLAVLKEKGLKAVRITELPESKHIFTHKEWHMTGFCIRVDELEPYRGEDEGLIFVEADRAEAEYPIPAAYAAYTRFLDIRLGNEKYEGKGIKRVHRNAQNGDKQ